LATGKNCGCAAQDTPITQLSGGQRMRVGLARLLIAEPALQSSIFLNIAYYRFVVKSFVKYLSQVNGHRRPVIGTAIDKFLKCGNLQEGFAPVSHRQWV
jgi:hypothetical protein